MEIVKTAIEFFFSTALFINALLFIPQTYRIIKEKTEKGVSLVTFCGFFLINLAIVLHAMVRADYVLLAGYIFSLITCGSVVLAILFYRFFRKSNAVNVTLEDVLDQIPGHVYWKDRVGVCLGSSRNNYEDFGLKNLNEFVGKTDYDLFSAEEADKLKLIDEEVMRTGETKVLEESLKNSSGEAVIYLSSKSPLKNSKGDIVGVIGVSMNITEAKQAVHEQLNMLEEIIAVMPGNVYWMDKQGVYLGANDNEARSIGLHSRKEIVGKRNVDIKNFVIPEALDPVNEKVLSSGKPVTAEEPAILKDGNQAVFLSSKVPLYNQKNEIIGLVGVSFDITQRKQQEQELLRAKEVAEIASKVKSEFIQNMEHDIRTPFVGVYGVVDLLARKESDPEKKELLEEATLCAKELLEYCDGILEFSRVESESLPLTSKSFDLHKLINSVLNIEILTARKKTLDLLLEYNETLPKIIMGDVFRLKRVLLNLVSNAIKFTKSGSVKLHVELERSEVSARQCIVRFNVSDTGIGIPEDKKNLIFERFSRLSPSNKGLYKGLGLGLSIVKRFVEDMGGDIHVESAMGEGSQFVILLPFKLPLSDDIIDAE